MCNRCIMIRLKSVFSLTMPFSFILHDILPPLIENITDLERLNVGTFLLLINYKYFKVLGTCFTNFKFFRICFTSTTF